MGPIAGLYGAICVGLFAAWFGDTSSQISGPTGPMTVVAASVFTQFAAEPAVAFTVVMMAGRKNDDRLLRAGEIGVLQ